MLIQIDNLSKSYYTKKVLSNINTNFESNKIHGIVGENGAGKTTLFHCLTSLTKYEGKIMFEKTQDPKNITGFLPAELYFYPRITGKQYIEFCLKARNQNLKQLKEWNDIFDLPLDEYAENYSTGMKKKLAIMAILLQENQLFILDEPFNGVDLISNMTLSKIFQKLKEQGKTIILSSHILSSLTDICDKIYHLKNGNIKTEYTKDLFGTIETDILKNTLNSKQIILDNIL